MQEARHKTTRGRVVRDHSLRRHHGGIPVTAGRRRVDPVREARPSDDEPDTVAADLIEYLVVEVPDLAALASLVPALVELVETSKIRILDLVALEKDGDGAVTVLELDAVDSMAALKEVDGEVGGMLSEHDIELASMALRPRTAGIVLVTEDRWAEPLSLAARRAGGQILGGERIPASRVLSVLTDRSERDKAGE
jgi:Family of unknown function (DUF6325)